VSRPQVVVPYLNLHPVTREVLDGYELDLEYVQVDDSYGYHALMRRLWAKGETVVIVEQDVCPWPGAIEELWQCPAAWCSYSYRMHGGIGIAHALGCTKLSDRLMRAIPDVWDEPAMWNVLDQVLFFAARDEGLEPHLHRPPVVHLSSVHRINDL
jgi:hypothetical protein